MDARKQALNLTKEYGNIYAAYAAVHNSPDAIHHDEQTEEVKRQLEHMILLEAMEEYGWEKTEDDKWRYVSNEEFGTRYRAAMRHNKE